jgi:nitroreductase
MALELPEGLPAEAVGVFEVLGTARAIRYFRPDPIPESVINQLIWAATRAPSPGNSQGWDFVVVDDRAALRRIGDALGAAMGPRIDQMTWTDDTSRRMLQGAKHLATTFGEAPLAIFVCGPVCYPEAAPQERFVWSATYPAAQNIVVAARALGLGAVLTTFQGVVEPVIRETLGIPDEIRIAATIPVGYPAAPHGPVTRKPVAEVIHRNRW